MSSSRNRLLRFVPGLAVVLAISVVGGGAWAVYSWLLDQEPDERKVIQQVTIIAPPPPPPPEIEQPPPPEIEEEVEVPEPELPDDLPETAEVPPGEQLGLDAEGGAGSDAFGLIGKKGGRGLLSGNPFAWYTGKVRDEILDLLSENNRLKREGYSVRIRLLIGRNGEVQVAELAGTTGSEKLDRELQLALSRIDRVSEPPPLEAGSPAPLLFQLRNRI